MGKNSFGVKPCRLCGEYGGVCHPNQFQINEHSDEDTDDFDSIYSHYLARREWHERAALAILDMDHSDFLGDD